MMVRARQRPRSAPGQTASIPSPTGGWNTRDPLDGMDPQDAIQLDNFFPETGSCRLREGSTPWCDTGESDPIGTLFPYAGGAAEKLLAAVNGAIYDVTTSVAASLATGYASDVWSWTNHASSGGTRIVACNASGTDVPFVYNGAAIIPIVVGGVAAASLSQVTLHAQRVWFVERNTLSGWYTASGAYQGALTKFDFGPLCRRGGSINALGTWTRDNGAGGADDLFVVVTTQGEVLIYSGIDPATADDWVLQGVFRVGKPVPGPRCLVNTGPDLVLLCADGFQPMSEYLGYGTTRANDTQLARKINGAAQDAVRDFSDVAGWQGVTWGEGSMLIINVPQSTTTAYQYVANTTTGAWCRFIGMNAYCWAVSGQDLYFGGADGTVWLGLVGAGDNSTDIVGTIVTSYQYVGGRGANKHFMMCRPVLQTNGPLQYSLGVSVDYADPATLATVNSNIPTAGLWGSGIWGSSTWGTSTMTLQRVWAGVSGIGYAVAVNMRVSTHTISVQCNSFDLMFERGWSI